MLTAKEWKEEMLSLSSDHTEHIKMLETEIRNLQMEISILRNSLKLLKEAHLEGTHHG